MTNSAQDTEDVVLVRLLEALACDCDNTDGWEAAAPDIRKAAQRIQSLSDRIDVPIPMLLYCPQCGQHHVDEPDERTPDWTNPPHRSHLCHDCGCIWRPADVPTTGVRAIQTQGKADTWTADRGNAESARAALHQEGIAP